MSRPEPLKPAYNFTSASEPVILSQGTIELSLDGAVYLGTADLLLQFVPSPRLIFHASVQGGKASPLVFAFNEPTESSFSFSGLKIDGFCGARKVGENFGNWELDWHPLEPLALCDIQPKDSVSAILHLFNFPDFHGGQYQDAAPAGCPLLVLSSEEWRFSVQALPDGATREAWKGVKNENGCLLTHVVKLERNDNKLFSGGDAKEQCHLLDNFLSFVKGGRCAPVCNVGFDAKGERTWATYATPRISSNPPYSWFNPQRGSQVESLFPLFAKRWQESDEWRECLRTAIYWYLQANTNGRSLHIDTGIVLAQAALERLAHHYVVVDRKMVSGQGFDDLRASDQLRMLLSLCGIPCEITNAVPDISKKNDTFKKDRRWLDGPHAITDIRNSLLHPVSKKDVSGCHFDAWKLSLWYLELSVLALCGYNGTYTNRLTATYITDSESVPWEGGTWAN